MAISKTKHFKLHKTFLGKLQKLCGSNSKFFFENEKLSKYYLTHFFVFIFTKLFLISNLYKVIPFYFVSYYKSAIRHYSSFAKKTSVMRNYLPALSEFTCLLKWFLPQSNFHFKIKSYKPEYPIFSSQGHTELLNCYMDRRLSA